MFFNFYILTVFLGSVTIIAGDHVHDYCYSEDTNRYRLFGGKTPYDAVRAENIVLMDAEQCKPVYIWDLVRHPTRTCGSECISSAELRQLLNRITENDLQICADDQTALRSWRFKGEDESIKRPKYRTTSQGFRDMEQYIRRLMDAFPKLLDPRQRTIRNYDFKSTSSDRCIEPAKVLVNVLLNANYRNVAQANIEINDPLLKVEEQIEKKETPQKKAFQNSQYMAKVIAEVNERLGFEDYDLTWTEVWQLYLYCSYDNSWSPDESAEVCAVFLPEHLKVFEYMDDIMIFYARGYGSSINTTFANRLIADLMSKLNAVTHYKTGSAPKVGALYLVHSNTIVPVLKKFGLYREADGLPISLETYEFKCNNRSFQCSFFNGFSANFMAVLFECSDDYYATFYINETLLVIPVCNNQTACSLTQLNEIFEFEIDQFKEYYSNYEEEEEEED